MRCVSCRQVRVCEGCGSRSGREATCRRCGRPTGPCPNCGGTAFEEMGSEPERLIKELNRRLGMRWPGSIRPNCRCGGNGT